MIDKEYENWLETKKHLQIALSKVEVTIESYGTVLVSSALQRDVGYLSGFNYDNPWECHAPGSKAEPNPLGHCVYEDDCDECCLFCKQPYDRA